MLLTEDIVPITYMSATGGNFLCHFIISAKRNIKTVIELSEHGNAHKTNFKDIVGPPLGPKEPDQYKIDFILSQLEHINQKGIPSYPVVQKPYYTTSHIVDINLISAYFKKFIRITYDLDDIEELATVFYGKWYIDEGHVKSVINTRRSHEIFIDMYQSKFTRPNLVNFNSKFTKLENMPNVLFISWKEFFKGNIEELITKLSIFTEIDTNNFSRESLMHWRNKTQYCIDKFMDIC